MDKLIGLALRARKITLGTELTIQKLRKNEIHLIVLAHDASLNTKKKVLDKASTYHTRVIEPLSGRELSQALGKNDIKVIGITDPGFSRLLLDEKRK
ncbi:MAG: ribosomal L7Ae/L30e/S12e/Gadd45 family protein [Acholeplasmataceae bacterium]|nr:ribosomal L7Ae/L30e/S12e/Gadd45 family protein [Acholeplasmataceae bacterium]